MKYLVARLSLSFLWIFTALTSIFWGYDVGSEILLDIGFSHEWLKPTIYSGAVLDLLIGFWLLSNKSLKLNYFVQFAVISVYSLILIIFAHEFLFHPFAPLLKNLPILALILILLDEDQAIPH